jgi:hypothetical protein
MDRTAGRVFCRGEGLPISEMRADGILPELFQKRRGEQFRRPASPHPPQALRGNWGQSLEIGGSYGALSQGSPLFQPIQLRFRKRNSSHCSTVCKLPLCCEFIRKHCSRWRAVAIHARSLAVFNHAVRWEWHDRNSITQVRQSAKGRKVPVVLTSRSFDRCSNISRSQARPPYSSTFSPTAGE